MFVAEHKLEHIYFTESSDRYPVEKKQQEVLSSKYEVVWAKCSPMDLGFPARRRRTFAAGINREKYVWVGPESAEGVQERWAAMFSQTPQLSGDAYFVASAGEIEEWVQRTADTRKFSLPENWRDLPMSQYLPALLPAGAVARHIDHMRCAQQQGKQTYLCDLDHHVGFGPASGECVPCLDSHPTIYSRAEQRILIPAELAAVMGFDVQEALMGGRPRSATGDALLSLADRDAKAIIGNGMHIPTFASWIFFILSDCVPRRQNSVPRPWWQVRRPTEEFEDES